MTTKFSLSLPSHCALLSSVVIIVKRRRIKSAEDCVSCNQEPKKSETRREEVRVAPATLSTRRISKVQGQRSGMIHNVRKKDFSSVPKVALSQFCREIGSFMLVWKGEFINCKCGLQMYGPLAQDVGVSKQISGRD
jgi:hypothetical protein